MDDETVDRVAQGLSHALNAQDGVSVAHGWVTVAEPLNIHALALSVARALFAGVVVSQDLAHDVQRTRH